ncbi:anhydro-N-acetylmuramic acid kinase [Gillisia sp. M10.2A]|uniref:Anhydro-N-acetylmuramic acid kinase n=1 Tax=Gillisia lutea TaxID=2909668 RepID=A0ABS9EGM4_9FLAO|nr:anhydro-N-acetylmuramic acid kinase [Gillisia lutea]MCF4102038.1 anhydro-N-acetylmuramic acid kinase [Gillisia lutea]
MTKRSFNVIGLMSGTSLDGLDLAYCKIFKEENAWNFKLLKSRSINYTEVFRNTLKASVTLSSVNLLILNNSFGTYLGEQVRDFINEEQLEVDFISSHGHTVFHQPEKGLTYQIGSGQHIATASNLKVISDFRTKDVTLGGQGAPFVPIGDQLFFSDFDFCLNLGGISNISYSEEGKRIAFDISPVNMLLNHLTNKIGKAYDDNGNLARKGTLNSELLKELNELEFYKLPFPKSLGYEWFQEKVIPIIDASSNSIEDLLHTSVHHIAYQIAECVNSTAKDASSKLLATGGGAKNGFFIETLQQYLQTTKLIVPNEELIDFKEAIVFALMGALRETEEINVLSSVTGACRNSCSGVIYLP